MNRTICFEKYFKQTRCLVRMVQFDSLENLKSVFRVNYSFSRVINFLVLSTVQKEVGSDFPFSFLHSSQHEPQRTIRYYSTNALQCQPLSAIIPFFWLHFLLFRQVHAYRAICVYLFLFSRPLKSFLFLWIFNKILRSLLRLPITPSCHLSLWVSFFWFFTHDPRLTSAYNTPNTILLVGFSLISMSIQRYFFLLWNAHLT